MPTTTETFNPGNSNQATRGRSPRFNGNNAPRGRNQPRQVRFDTRQNRSNSQNRRGRSMTPNRNRSRTPSRSRNQSNDRSQRSSRNNSRNNSRGNSREPSRERGQKPNNQLTSDRKDQLILNMANSLDQLVTEENPKN